MIELEKKEEAKWKPKDIKRSPSTAAIFDGGKTFDGGETFDGGTTFDGDEATEIGSILVVVESRWWLNQKCVWTDCDWRERKNDSSVHWMWIVNYLQYKFSNFN